MFDVVEGEINGVTRRGQEGSIVKMVLAAIFLIFIIFYTCAGHDIKGQDGNGSRTVAREEETAAVKSVEEVKTW